MRITNCKSSPVFVEEANKTLEPGAASRELPLTAAFGKTLRKLMASGSIKISLSDDDRDFLEMLMVSDSEPMPEIKPAAKIPPKTPAQVRRDAEIAKAKARQERAVVNARRLPVPKVNPNEVGGCPDLGSMPIPTVMTGKPGSISDMVKHNQALAAQKRAAISDAQTILKSRV